VNASRTVKSVARLLLWLLPLSCAGESTANVAPDDAGTGGEHAVDAETPDAKTSDAETSDAETSDAVTSDADASGPSFDVYVLIGQSNMDGRASVATTDAGGPGLTDAQRAPRQDTVIFYRNPPAPGTTQSYVQTQDFVPLTPGYSVPPGFTGPLPSSVFGPEIGFSIEMAQSQPNRLRALVKASKGGTSLYSDWKPGTEGDPSSQGYCFRNFVETLGLAKAALARRGARYAFRGVLWHQGESDVAYVDGGADVYAAMLRPFITRVREEIGDSKLPFVIGEVYDNGMRGAVIAAQQLVASQGPYTGFASSDALTTFDGGTHFDARSQLLLGQRFAQAMLPLLE
jgi:iduronate 2-sulfatase